MTSTSKEIRDCFFAHTIKVRAAKGRYVTPAMMSTHKFVNTDVVGIVEGCHTTTVVKKRVSPTIVRKRVVSAVVGIAD